MEWHTLETSRSGLGEELEGLGGEGGSTLGKEGA